MKVEKRGLGTMSVDRKGAASMVQEGGLVEIEMIVCLSVQGGVW